MLCQWCGREQTETRWHACGAWRCRVAVLLAAASDAALAAWAAAVPSFVPALLHPCFQVGTTFLCRSIRGLNRSSEAQSILSPSWPDWSVYAQMVVMCEVLLYVMVLCRRPVRQQQRARCGRTCFPPPSGRPHCRPWSSCCLCLMRMTQAAALTPASSRCGAHGSLLSSYKTRLVVAVQCSCVTHCAVAARMLSDRVQASALLLLQCRWRPCAARCCCWQTAGPPAAAGGPGATAPAAACGGCLRSSMRWTCGWGLPRRRQQEHPQLQRRAQQLQRRRQKTQQQAAPSSHRGVPFQHSSLQ